MTRPWWLVVLVGGCVRHDVAEVCVRGEGTALEVRASFSQDIETGPREMSCAVEGHGDALRVRTRGVYEADRSPLTTPLIYVYPVQVPCALEGVGALGRGEHVLVYRGDALRVSLPAGGDVQCFPSRVPVGHDDVARQVFPEVFDTGPARPGDAEDG